MTNSNSESAIVFSDKVIERLKTLGEYTIPIADINISETIPNIKRLEEAISEALGRSKRRNFQQSVELIVVLRGLNLKDPSSKIRETTFLPNPISKRVKIF